MEATMQTTPTPAGSLVIPFGQYRGRPIADLPDDYLAWLATRPDLTVRLNPGRKLRLRVALTMELQRRLDDPEHGRIVAAMVKAKAPDAGTLQ